VSGAALRQLVVSHGLDRVEFIDAIVLASRAASPVSPSEPHAPTQPAAARADPSPRPHLAQRHNSKQQREIVERNATAGLRPTVVTFTTLMSRLLLEGKRHAALAVMGEMEAAGLVPDHR
jgi:pentatricopeptide repeat protein